ncbi:hypothetical protein CBR_g28494 [Chara braunii]|uniref:Uncharacterized protein n=1 Tax=Chara braunii TaxID=69332 RepID=A0A388JW71_CHABU|nr:hypothetical protein CBR_g28494 [Chara braunii]|eukprot:GBG62018.1 hypothetical protein CBR_g28494 [Chara braunii]
MPKIPLTSPKPFSGDRKKDEDLDIWVRTVPTYVRHKLTKPEQEVVVAASFLEGSAARWLNGLVQQQGYGQNFDAWAQSQTLEEFVRSVYNRWHEPQGAQKATDAINSLCSRRFKNVRELTDTVEGLLVVPGVRFDQQVLLTDYLRCLPAEVRTKLVDEAYVEQHTFATFSKKALDIEAKLGSAHQTSSIRRETELPDIPYKALNSRYRHVVHMEDCPAMAEASSSKPIIDTSPEASSSPRGGAAVDKGAAKLSQTSKTKAWEEEMISGLQQVPWRKVDVDFRAAYFPFMAHNFIHVKTKWIHFEGAGVIKHLIDMFVDQEERIILDASL